VALEQGSNAKCRPRFGPEKRDSESEAKIIFEEEEEEEEEYKHEFLKLLIVTAFSQLCER
jgi:hypothetical protein